MKWGFVDRLRTRNRFRAPTPWLASQPESGVADEEGGKATAHLLQIVLGSHVTKRALIPGIKTFKSCKIVLSTVGGLL